MAAVQPRHLPALHPVEVRREEDAVLQRHVRRPAEVERRRVEVRAALGLLAGVDRVLGVEELQERARGLLRGRRDETGLDGLQDVDDRLEEGVGVRVGGGTGARAAQRVRGRVRIADDDAHVLLSISKVSDVEWREVRHLGRGGPCCFLYRGGRRRRRDYGDRIGDCLWGCGDRDCGG